MSEYKEAVLQEASRILEYILKQELNDEEKERIISDSIDNFNEHVNPGWLKYRKSVSTDAAFVEWEDSRETFKDTGSAYTRPATATLKSSKRCRPS